MTDGIMKFKQAFGDIKLSQVGTGSFPAKPEPRNVWGEIK